MKHRVPKLDISAWLVIYYKFSVQASLKESTRNLCAKYLVKELLSNGNLIYRKYNKYMWQILPCLLKKNVYLVQFFFKWSPIQQVSEPHIFVIVENGILIQRQRFQDYGNVSYFQPTKFSFAISRDNPHFILGMVQPAVIPDYRAAGINRGMIAQTELTHLNVHMKSL